MTPAERNAICEECAVIAENETDGQHVGNLRAQQIADLIRSSKDQPTMDPTARGDMIAESMRRWYEANRETWWERHRPNADRRGAHADGFMLRFLNAVGEAEAKVKF